MLIFVCEFHQSSQPNINILGKGEGIAVFPQNGWFQSKYSTEYVGDAPTSKYEFCQ